MHPWYLRPGTWSRALSVCLSPHPVPLVGEPGGTSDDALGQAPVLSSRSSGSTSRCIPAWTRHLYSRAVSISRRTFAWMDTAMAGCLKLKGKWKLGENSVPCVREPRVIRRPRSGYFSPSRVGGVVEGTGRFKRKEYPFSEQISSLPFSHIVFCETLVRKNRCPPLKSPHLFGESSSGESSVS